MYRFVLLLLVFTRTVSFAQISEPKSEGKQPLPREKVYISTDRDVYLSDETIWFSAFVVNERLMPSALSKIVYVELINSTTQEVVEKKIVELTNGFGRGDFELISPIRFGNYSIRAYTRYLLNFPDSFLFHKDIDLLSSELFTNKEEIKETIEDELDKRKKSKNETEYEKRKLDVQFFTEGGDLLAGVGNRVAVKALDFYGHSISVQGNIVNSNGEIISAFETTHKGMGLLPFFPKEGEKYHAEFRYNNIDYEVDFPPVVTKGVSLSVRERSSEELIVQFKSKQLNTFGTLIGVAKGREAFRLPITKATQSLLVETGKLAGILKIIYVDPQQQPVAERQFFVYPEKETVSVSMQPEFYQDSIGQIHFPEQDSLIANSRLTAKIIDHEVQTEQSDQNILTNLLLTSDLAGNIEKPNYYFTDSISLQQRKKHLDFVMLTHGWADFSPTNNEIIYLPEKDGFNRQFRLIKYREYATKEEPVIANLQVTTLENMSSYSASSGEDGVVYLTGMDLRDTTTLHLKANYDKGYKVKRKKIKTTFDPIDIQKRELNPAIKKKIYTVSQVDSTSNRVETIMENNWRINAAYSDILLEPVTVTANQLLDERFENRSMFYNTPDDRILSEDIIGGGLNLRDFLMRVPGFRVSGGISNPSVSFRNGPVSYRLDGMQVDEQMAFSMSGMDIDYVDVIKGAQTAIFGPSGGNAVVAIHTKRGSSATYTIDPASRGLLNVTIPGYSKAREYYNPMFTDDELKKKPYSPTLYWNGNVTSGFEFRTPAFSGDYTLILEGLTPEGKVIYTRKNFSVY